MWVCEGRLVDCSLKSLQMKARIIFKAKPRNERNKVQGGRYVMFHGPDYQTGCFTQSDKHSELTPMPWGKLAGGL